VMTAHHHCIRDISGHGSSMMEGYIVQACAAAEVRVGRRCDSRSKANDKPSASFYRDSTHRWQRQQCLTMSTALHNKNV